MTTEFEIVKGKGGFFVFEGLTDQWTVCLPTRRAAERWVEITIAARAEVEAEAIRAAEIAAFHKAERASMIAASRAAAPVQLSMF